MTRRIALVAMAALFVAMPSCQKVDKRVNQSNFEQIKVGMTRAEVEAFLGPKYDDDPSLALGEGSTGAGAVGIADPGSLGGGGTPALKWAKWGSDKKCIMVCFNRQDKVHEKKAVGLQ